VILKTKYIQEFTYKICASVQYQEKCPLSVLIGSSIIKYCDASCIINNFDLFVGLCLLFFAFTQFPIFFVTFGKILGVSFPRHRVC
jgi:hypothetical protein